MISGLTTLPIGIIRVARRLCSAPILVLGPLQKKFVWPIIVCFLGEHGGLYVMLICRPRRLRLCSN